MPPVTHQQFGAFIQCIGDVKVRYRAAGGHGEFLPLVGNNRRAIVDLRQPRSCQPHHAFTEGRIGGKEQQRIRVLFQNPCCSHFADQVSLLLALAVL